MLSSHQARSLFRIIPPGQGLIRFDPCSTFVLQAEIEHFVNPDDKSHPRFKEVADLAPLLYSRCGTFEMYRAPSSTPGTSLPVPCSPSHISPPCNPTSPQGSPDGRREEAQGPVSGGGRLTGGDQSHMTAFTQPMTQTMRLSHLLGHIYLECMELLNVFPSPGHHRQRDPCLLHWPHLALLQAHRDQPRDDEVQAAPPARGTIGSEWTQQFSNVPPRIPHPT